VTSVGTHNQHNNSVIYNHDTLLIHVTIKISPYLSYHMPSK